MPYLTSTKAGIASTDVRTGFGIPGFAHPLVAPTEWGELTRPGIPLHWVVLNVADGPGSRPDPHCLDAAGRLRNAGVRVLGHLDSAYGARTFGEVISDAHRYIDWYQVDGFLLDRCPAERVSLPEVRRTVTTLRGIRDDAHIVLGHGTHPHPGYAESADQLVTFSGSWSDYRWSQVAEWTADHPPELFCHFVHGVPRPHLEEALRIARWQGASTIYFTDHTDRGGRSDPWETMPGYWDEIVSRIGTGVSE
ncbi:spherulation-specific family 4 protein [Streptomyces coacervatus]|uniref:Spherulation-specific family 4 protein n=1 Tax=Streptomyces coacervatus TaxID=647381 RepID=A0ABP7IZM1_9ACTN|nr:spherulation-specific family 4 protein [Streptomyces coacervatus]MDF2270034.1 spherulation-specific family 4 protein [Streptomyces coacervatus]